MTKEGFSANIVLTKQVLNKTYFSVCVKDDGSTASAVDKCTCDGTEVCDNDFTCDKSKDPKCIAPPGNRGYNQNKIYH